MKHKISTNGQCMMIGEKRSPLELADSIGLDQLLKGLEYMHREWSEKYGPSPLPKQKCEQEFSELSSLGDNDELRNHYF